MKKVRLESWIRAGRWVDLLEFALLCAVAVTLAHWTWIWLAPRPVAASALFAAGDSSQAPSPVKRNLFGVAAPGMVPQREAASGLSLRLLGVVSPGSAGKGRAIFATESGARRVANAGELLSAGVVLNEVHADHVVLTRDGAVQRLALERRAAAVLSGSARRDAPR
ncbi:MAG: hypothetical protein H7Y16_08360 [Candidatus Parcubacteria bacterium]|nr:hypothetical protein [Burkholderiales bacterium]